MNTVLLDRLEAVKGIPLGTDSHEDPADRVPGAFCVMEKFAYITGQEWTDSPDNCCPTIGAFLRRYNDKTDQAGRDEIDVWVLANVDRLVATASDGFREERGYLIADWALRHALPVWLEVAKAPEAAARMRALAPIVDWKTSQAGRSRLREVRNGLLDYWKWRRALCAKVKAAVREALAEKKNAVAAAVAVADAAAVAVAAANANADAIAVAAADADAVAIAVAAANANADADAIAAADAAAVAAAAADGTWDDTYSRVYAAVKEKLTPIYEARAEEAGVSFKGAAIALLERMVSLGEETSGTRLRGPS